MGLKVKIQVQYIDSDWVNLCFFLVQYKKEV